MLYYWALNWSRVLLNFSKSEIQICTWRLGRSLISIPEAEIGCSGWSQESLAVPSVSTQCFELIQAKVVKYKVENLYFVASVFRANSRQQLLCVHVQGGGSELVHNVWRVRFKRGHFPRTIKDEGRTLDSECRTFSLKD